jgi:hypothetical protein
MLAFAEELGKGTSRLSAEWKRLLIMNSDHDEAFQLLSRIVPLKNPFTRKNPVPRSTRFVVWWKGFQSLVSQIDKLRFPNKSNAALVYLILYAVSGAVLFSVPGNDVVTYLRIGYPIFATLVLLISLSDRNSVAPLVCLPGRLLSFIFALATSASSNLIFWIVRRVAWRQLTRYALGTIGFPFATRPVSTTPSWVSDEFYDFKPLSEAIVGRALARRNQGIGTSIDLLTDFLAHGDITFDNVDRVLSKIASDATLVHAAYYTDPDAIEDIAQWIARSEDALKKEWNTLFDEAVDAAFEEQDRIEALSAAEKAAPEWRLWRGLPRRLWAGCGRRVARLGRWPPKNKEPKK